MRPRAVSFPFSFTLAIQLKMASGFSESPTLTVSGLWPYEAIRTRAHFQRRFFSQIDKCLRIKALWAGLTSVGFVLSRLWQVFLYYLIIALMLLKKLSKYFIQLFKLSLVGGLI